LSQKTKHIAVIRLSAMGDVAMTVPVIRAFVQQHPDVKLTIVSRPFFKPFFNGIQNLSFFAVDLEKRHKGFLGLLRLFSDLKKANINQVADLHNVLRSKIIRILFALSGKKVAFTDKGRAEKKALTRFKNKIFKPVKSMFERHVDTFNQLGFSIDLAQPIVPQKEILTEEVTTISGKKDQLNWIGIAPFAQYQTKTYPLDLMQETIQQLALNSNNKIFLFGGGEKEIDILNSFANNNNILVIAGKLAFENELKLISNLDVMLSMDSGNAHIAAMLGIKTITLWGATHPFTGFAPFNQPLENSLVSDRAQYPLLPTSIYGNKKVEGYEDAMRTISPKTIIDKIQKEIN
jgi:ADP-heptose:LPS heptosyltransferase